MGIVLYNTLSGKKEALQTIEPGKVRFYACGPTVYNLFHVGNARMFVVFDTVRRYLEYRGYEVKYIQNFTDVDDKIIQRANDIGEDVRSVADFYIDAYFKDAETLGVRRAVVHPRVTECIPEIISFIQDLIDKGHAYAINGNVYFDTSSFPGYGKLSGQSVDDLRAGFRIDVSEEKDDPTDFALWKAAKEGEEYWAAPWGDGRPGWHIECSVMSRLHLGEEIDIHGGGRDLVFPHHENEIAQSEAHSGHSFARYWMHNGTLNIDGEKMSKSLGNFIMTRDLIHRRAPRTIRYFLLSAQYRHPLNYTEQAMDQCVQALERIDRSMRNLQHRKAALLALPGALVDMDQVVSDRVTSEVNTARNAFIEAMDDDFNTADGISAIFEAVRLANTYLVSESVRIADIDAWLAFIEELLEVLGLLDLVSDTKTVNFNDEVEALIEERNSARKRRDFGRADAIRTELLGKGIVLEDTAQGTRWSPA